MNYEHGRFYGLQEIADDLRLPKSSLARWCREGKLQGVMFGKKWMIDGGEVERLRREGVPQDRKPKEQEQQEQEREPVQEMEPKQQEQEKEKEPVQESEPEKEQEGTDKEPDGGQEPEKEKEHREQEQQEPKQISVCTVCGKEFESKSGSGIYCSAKCRQRAYRARKKEQEGKE